MDKYYYLCYNMHLMAEAVARLTNCSHNQELAWKIHDNIEGAAEQQAEAAKRGAEHGDTQAKLSATAAIIANDLFRREFLSDDLTTDTEHPAAALAAEAEGGLFLIQEDLAASLREFKSLHSGLATSHLARAAMYERAMEGHELLYHRKSDQRCGVQE